MPWDNPDALVASVEDFLTSDAEPEGARSEGFVLRHDDDAEWAMRSYAQATRDLAAISRQAAIVRDRINRWERTMSVPLLRDQNFYDSLLSEYAKRVRRETNEVRKTVSLPSGNITTKAAPTKGSIEVVNIDEFVEWAQRTGHTDWLKTTYAPKVADIKASADFDGENLRDPLGDGEDEIIAGLRHIEGEVTVSIKVAEES